MDIENSHSEDSTFERVRTSTSISDGLTRQVKDRYDEIAFGWRAQVWVHDTEFKRKIVEFANIDNPDANLLDVGTGAGDLAALFGVKSVTGVDISQAMLAEGKRLHPDFNFVSGDAENLPLRNQQFDIVCSRNLLQNFNDPSSAFKEMVRVLKSGGKLLVVESAVDESEREFPTQNLRTVEPFHPLFPSHQMINKLFKDNGMRGIEQEVTGVHKLFLEKWCKAHGATTEQRLEIYKQCEAAPEWYKKKYEMQFYPDNVEIDMILPFSILIGYKK